METPQHNTKATTEGKNSLTTSFEHSTGLLLMNMISLFYNCKTIK